jgi:hypothetical protein
MRQIFKDEEHNRLFEEDGYVLLKAFEPDVIKRIEEFYLANSEQNFKGWHHSLELHSPERKAKIGKFLARVYDEHLSRYFNDYRAISGTFVSKKSDSLSRVNPHQDWSFVDEAKYVSLNLWAPLCDTSAENGALGVFKGSHKLKRTIRGSNILQSLKMSPHALKHITFFNMKVGEVIMYDHRLIHMSGANRSGGERTAISISVVPSDATPVHYVCDSQASRILELEVDEEFFYNFHIDKSKYVNGSTDHVVDTVGYRGREIEFAPENIGEQDILRLYEARPVVALRQIKNHLKAKVSLLARRRPNA